MSNYRLDDGIHENIPHVHVHTSHNTLTLGNIEGGRRAPPGVTVSAGGEGVVLGGGRHVNEARANRLPLVQGR